MSGSGVGDDGGAVTAWERARAGDGEAFGEVYDACHRRVYRHALRLLASPHDAEDALAATFLELWRRREEVRVVDGSVLPWLLVTATNTARNLARSHRRYRALLARLPAPVHSPDVADHLLDERLDGTSPGLLAALSALNATDRGLIALVALEGWPIGEADRGGRRRRRDHAGRRPDATRPGASSAASPAARAGILHHHPSRPRRGDAMTSPASGPELRSEFSEHLRAVLVEEVERDRAPVVARRRWRRLLVGAGLGLAVLGGGVAVAQGTLLPGADRVTPLGSVVTLETTGTASLALGPVPDGATTVEITFTCLSALTFTFADGAGGECRSDDAAAPASGRATTLYSQPVDLEGDRLTITVTPPDAAWSASAVYSRRDPTQWGTNAAGETYGVPHDGGTPDLMAAEATNGCQGYVRSADLPGPRPTSPEQAAQWQQDGTLGAPRSLPVLDAEGTSVIGEFVLGGAPVAVERVCAQEP